MMITTKSPRTCTDVDNTPQNRGLAFVTTTNHVQRTITFLSQIAMALNPGKMLLKQKTTALLICDVQDKFSKVIFEFDKMITNTAKLINACKLLEVPMLVTEQNPKNLGSTVAAFDISGAKGPFAKFRFSMYTPEVSKALDELCSGNRPESVVLVGLEAHVCVEQTAVDLRKEGFQVHAVADCISSRTQEDRILALSRMRDIGCVIATSENVIFKLLGDAKHEQFKKVQALVKLPTADTGLVAAHKL